MTLSSEPDHAPNTKLPLGAAISLAYATVFQNFADVLRACGLWVIAAAAISGLGGWIQGSWMGEAFASIARGTSPQMAFGSRPIGLLVLLGLGNLILILGGVSIAVAWHRYIILNERPGASGSNVFTRDVWRYVWAAIVVVVVIALPVAIFIGPAVILLSFQTLSSVATLLFIIGFILYFLAIVAFFRFLLVFPARAVGDVGLTLRDSWSASRRSGWRIFWGIVVCSLLPALIFQVAVVLMLGFPGSEMFKSANLPVRLALTNAILMSVYLLITPISIGFLSHAYRYLVRLQALPSAPPSVPH